MYDILLQFSTTVRAQLVALAITRHICTYTKQAVLPRGGEFATDSIVPHLPPYVVANLLSCIPFSIISDARHSSTQGARKCKTIHMFCTGRAAACHTFCGTWHRIDAHLHIIYKPCTACHYSAALRRTRHVCLMKLSAGGPLSGT